MNTSQRIWAYLLANPGAHSHAVAASVGEAVDKVQRTLNKAVTRGKARSEGPNGQRRYTLVSRPKPVAATPEERRARRTATQRQWRARQAKPEGEPKSNPRAMTVVKRKPVAAPGPRDVSADVAAFLKAGGRIQRLPRHAVSQPLLRIGVKA